jgi:uroporphyrinogen decarboxylase
MDEMKSRERYFAFVQGKLPDRVPVDPMLESVFTMAQIGKSAAAFYLDSETCTEGLIATWKKFGFDVIQAGCTLPQYVELVGGGWTCSENGYPIASSPEPVFKSIDDIDKAEVRDVRKSPAFKVIIETISKLVKRVGKEVIICCRCPGTFNLVRYLIGTDLMFRSLATDHALIERAADIACDMLIEAGKAYGEAGADVVWYPDACSSTAFISPEQYEELAMSRHARFFAAMKKAGLITIYHPDGNEYGILCQVKSIPGIDVYHMSQEVDIGIVRAIYGRKALLYGNLSGHGALLLKTPEEIEEETRLIIEKAGRHGKFVMSPAINMPGNTPPENLKAMVDAAKKYGKYPMV